MTERQMTPEDTLDVEKAYPSLRPDAECWIVVARGSMVFRFGPYTPPQAGAIMSESLERKVVVSVVMNCGPEFDWELAADLASEAKPAEPDLSAEIPTRPPQAGVMNALTLRRLTAALRVRTNTCAKFANCHDWSLNDWAVALEGEIGEACNVLKKVRRGDAPLSAFKIQLESEIVDALCYLLQLADRADIDITAATEKTFNEVSAREGSHVRL